jgi:hypothetical protein
MSADWMPEAGMQVCQLGQHLLRVWFDPYEPSADPWIWELLEVEADAEGELTEIEAGSAASCEEAQAAAEAAWRRAG